MADTSWYPMIGTNPTPYFVSQDENPETVRTNQGYFYIQIYGAQAAFQDHCWKHDPKLTVASQVNLHLADQHDLGERDLRSIIQCREISKNHAVQLGFSPMLVEFVPAKMKRISLSVEYLVDTEDYLRTIVGLINDQNLHTAISLAPGASMVATAVGGLAEKVLNAFMPANERKPILQFSGDFDLTDEGLREGYYVILGSFHSDSPLPRDLPDLRVVDGGRLLIDEQPVTQLSYVILKVGCVRAIRDWCSSSQWNDKLREVRRLATDYAEDIFSGATWQEKKEFWESECLPLIREARALLKADPNLLDSEAELIYRDIYKQCQELIKQKADPVATAEKPAIPVITRSERQAAGAFGTVKRGQIDSGRVPEFFERLQRPPGVPAFDYSSFGAAWEPDENADKKVLGIPEGDDLDAQVNAYAEQLEKARKTFDYLRGT